MRSVKGFVFLAFPSPEAMECIESEGVGGGTGPAVLSIRWCQRGPNEGSKNRPVSGGMVVIWRGLGPPRFEPDS